MGNSKKSATALAEEQVLKDWQRQKTFERSLAQREEARYFAFNDGPPFANGLPHFGHSLVTAIKDSVLRYKTMRGYFVPRRNGWDCHGLPVEYDVEREFGIAGKKQILELGLDKFNAASRESIFRYKAQWEEFLIRFGRWSDYENYYATVDTNYTESVWWVLKQIHGKGLLYRGLKSTPYCPRCETPLSNFELNEGYRDNVPDPSIFVLFPLCDDPKTKLLAWTTTPWTLPANAALAVKPDADYAYVKLKTADTTLILAKERLDVLDLRQSDYSLIKTVKGQKLAGLRYESLYPLPKDKFSPEQVQKAHQVLVDRNVSLEDGSGILHVAPRYGETDLDLGLKENLPLIESVNGSGQLIFGPKAALGRFFKAADEPIIVDLTRQGRIFAAETAEHTYPFCWRCETPLMYFASSTWFIEVSKIKDQLVKTAENINWVPAHIKVGRFGKWLEGARDWAISRNRYWGAPMPIWQNVEDENDYIIVGSITELEELSGVKLSQIEGGAALDLHRPYIDEIVINQNGHTYKRIEEVLDCWFESASMPVAQWHYPFENKAEFERSFPADFVTEGLDQTRLWFYVQHVISTILFNKPAFKNVIVNGIILAADGQKLSKRLHNYPPTEDVFNDEGADAWRLYLLSSTQATEAADYMLFEHSGLRDLSRNLLDTLSNSYKFFKTYAEVDDWSPKKFATPNSEHILDQWILARLNETIAASTKSADAFKIAHAILPIFGLVDDLSNWYIRRSRRRFWKSENDKDKQQAYATLHFVLVRACQLLAPWAPFISDELWGSLTKGLDLPKSVHLTDWPQRDEVNVKLLEDMKQVRLGIANTLSQRAEEKIKVRQPLSKVTFNLRGIDSPKAFNDIISEEVNVKEVAWGQNYSDPTRLAVGLTPELKKEGFARDLVRQIQDLRKYADLKVDDKIELRVESDDPFVMEAFEDNKKYVYTEVLGKELAEPREGVVSRKPTIEGHIVSISLQKV